MPLVFYCRYGEICFYFFGAHDELSPGGDAELCGARPAVSLPSFDFLIIDPTYASLSPFMAPPSSRMMARGGLGENKSRDNRTPLGGWLVGNELRHNRLETNYDITTGHFILLACACERIYYYSREEQNRSNPATQSCRVHLG